MTLAEDEMFIPKKITEEYINDGIWFANKYNTPPFDTNKISDGYHTFGELYEHRITLFKVLCRLLIDRPKSHFTVWRSKFHSDETPVFDGWFIAGIGLLKGSQITYHLPISEWDEWDFVHTLNYAPTFDGHTSNDVVMRLNNLIKEF